MILLNRSSLNHGNSSLFPCKEAYFYAASLPARTSLRISWASRAQVLLLLLIVDEHLKDSPPALGLGTDAEWFGKLVEVWPPHQQKTRKAKSGASVAQEGVVQHGFEW